MAGFLLMMPRFIASKSSGPCWPSHLLPTGFSQYPRTKINVFSSPGASVTFSWWEAIGYQSAEEIVPARIKAVDRGIDAVDRVMIPPLAVFRFMENGTALDLHLADREVSLEIGHVVHGIPEAPFNIGKQAEIFCFTGFVAECELLNFAGVVHGNEDKQVRSHAVLFGAEDRVAEAVPAFVCIERSPDRLPGGIPDRVAVLYIEVFAVVVKWDVVVAVAGHPEKLGILIEGVAPTGVGNQRKEVFGTEIIDPRQRSFRSRDHIFAALIIEVTVFHFIISLRNRLRY